MLQTGMTIFLRPSQFLSREIASFDDEARALQKKLAEVDDLISMHRHVLSQVFTGLNERVVSITTDLKESKFI